MQPLKIQEDGFLDIIIPIGVSESGEENVITHRFDVYLASELFSKAARDANGDTSAYDANLRAVMTGYGLPSSLSYRMNARIAEAVWEKQSELEKKDKATRPQNADAGLPDSMG